MRIVVLVGRDRKAPSFLARCFDGVWEMPGPVPVKVQSEAPSSKCLGDFLPWAMFDFGDCWYDVREIERDTDLEKSEE